ncbi:hypothetical protein E2562_039465, partial [Oryza meyeriana var. granulata]
MEEADDASALDPKLAPLLLFGHGDATYLYSVPTRASLPRRVDVDDMMRGHRWWTTAQGWLLMTRRGSPYTLLWDPFTGRSINLPNDHEGTILTQGGRRRLTAMDGKFYTDLIDNVGVLEFSPEPVFTLTAVDGDDRGPYTHMR